MSSSSSYLFHGHMNMVYPFQRPASSWLFGWGGLKRKEGGAHVGAYLVVKVVHTGISTVKYVTTLLFRKA